MKLVFYSGGHDFENISLDEDLIRLAQTKNPQITYIPSCSYLCDNDFSEFILDNGNKPNKSAIQPFYLHKTATSSLEKKFINYLENNTDKIDWWFKNGDYGRDNFGIEYRDENNELKTFYPDFIIKQGSRIGLFDTKGGVTAKNASERAKGLHTYIQKVNNREEFDGFEHKNKSLELWGGILVESSDLWRINSSENYKYNSKDLSGWDNFKL